MSTSMGRPRGPLRHWYLDLALAFAAVTIAVHVLEAGLPGLLLTRAELRLVSLLVEASGLHALAAGYDTLIVYGGRHVVTVVLTPACSGIYAATAFAVSAAVLPGVGWRQRLSAVAVYAPTVLAANVVRVFAAAAIGAANGPAAMRIFHDYVGSAFFLVLYAVLWVDWLYRSLGGSRHLSIDIEEAVKRLKG